MVVVTDGVQRVLHDVASKYPGPGGAIAVLLEGRLINTHVWGYADMERRISMTSDTLIPICSITKQFVAYLVRDLRRNPPTTLSSSSPNDLTDSDPIDDHLQRQLREVLPSEFVDQHGLSVDNLIDMASGLRDYWALCTVQGSRPESVFSIDKDAPDMLRRIKSLHFESGTEYSYSNTNFHIVERLVERVTGVPLAKLLSERVLKPAKMQTACLCPRTDRHPAPIIGYEGTRTTGFRPADNFIEWSADAGMVASLNDMIAYEKYFDSNYTDPSDTALLDAIETRKYKNGGELVPSYRHGLGIHDLSGYKVIGHGGAIRGYRLNRSYVVGERLSVVVLFNHTSEAGDAAQYIIKQLLGISEPKQLIPPIEPATDWFGSFLDNDTQLSVRIEPGDAAKSQIKMTYSRGKEQTLTLSTPTTAKCLDTKAELRDGELHINRIHENRNLVARRLKSRQTIPSESLVGIKFWCDETESTFRCEGQGTMLYGMFDGCFGQGPPHLMAHLGEGVWILADHRSMDDTAPGEWTLVFKRDANGAVVSVTIGCWLARKLEFLRV